uniref:Uncharacterized protein n=1 Tax=Setaria italica TaxID=4555 RepID=K3YLZ5_SETIT
MRKAKRGGADLTKRIRRRCCPEHSPMTNYLQVNHVFNIFVEKNFQFVERQGVLSPSVCAQDVPNAQLALNGSSVH